MLPEDQFVVSVFAAAGIEESSLHATAEGTERVALELRLSSLNDGFREHVVGHSERCEVGREGSRVVGRGHRVDGHRR